ncbi:hypothetical protein PT057_08255 [Erysipelothrix rhusiopathiae]|nr:hypothetical protein [Erysipelothrix rhusiopathiae]MDE8091161.1 hypothetical protein [Erysipelothrix rhusiopathiae]
MRLKVFELSNLRDENNDIIITETYILNITNKLQSFSEIFGGEFKKNRLTEEKGVFFLPYDMSSDEIIRILEYDDFYGEVKFGVASSELTIEQLLEITGNDENTLFIVPSMGVGGGGPEISTIMDGLVDCYCLFNNLMLEQPALIFLTQGAIILAKSQRNRIKKIVGKVIEKYDRNNVNPLSFIDYIQSKNVWTMDELKLRFNEKDELVLHEMMILSFYNYNERTKEYYPLSTDVLQLEIDDIILQDQLEIIAYYVFFLKNHKNDGSIELEYLLSRLSREYEEDVIKRFIHNIDTIYKKMEEG